MNYIYKYKLKFLFLVLFVFSARTFSQAQAKEVAVTIDDLPVVTISRDFQTSVEITQKLLKTLTGNNIPVTGFVIGKKLYKDGKIDGNEINLLKMWLNAGLDLGNHTFNHPSLNNTDLETYKDEVIKCDDILKKILAEYNEKPEYLRQPYLQFGKDPEKIKSYYKFLKENSYKMAPVTIDNSDWIFARAYEIAIRKNNKALQDSIAKAYIPYMISKFDYYRKQSNKLFSYEVKQILLMHANRINADHLNELLAAIKKEGYKFISLEEALKDNAYKHEDSYLGNAGISWIHRWAITEGKKREFFGDEPTAPKFVMEAAGVKSE